MSTKNFGTANVRCATLIGHVDHGKSSYADSLLAANGIIAPRQAGKLRYLDSREDEQERGITMESSAVSLSFKLRAHSTDGKVGEISDYMINLIDTPGHIDFSSEVSTASRLCDGALVIVDVVEGVCTQTIAVLRQAWTDRLAPILVLNKMDRLVTELRLSPSEAYHHLTQLIENVNAVMGSFFASERMEDDLRWHEAREARLRARREAASESVVGQSSSDSNGHDALDEQEDEERYQELDDEDIYFDPARGNVIFASAIDNWAFRLDRFSQLYSKKLGIQESKFRKVLWGDFFFDPKGKRVIGHKQKEREGKNLKPVFVQFVLDNVWAVYESALNRDQEKIEKIVKTLELKILPRDIRAKESSTLLPLIFSQWLPLAACTFSALVQCVPPPAVAQRTRVAKMLHPELSYFSKKEASTPLEVDLFEARAGDGARTCAYVSKLFAVRRGELPEGRRKELTADEMRQRGKEARERAAAAKEALLRATGASEAQGSEHSSSPQPEAHKTEEGTVIENGQAGPSARELAQREEDENQARKDEEVVLGFARLYSGVLQVGRKVFALLPKYDPALKAGHAANAKHIREVNIEALYMMMGRDLIAVSEVPAGNVFAIRGLEGTVLRNATLCAPPVTKGSPATQELDVASSRDCFVNLAGVGLGSAPIVRVALEPSRPTDMPKLVEGLRLLNQADPCVETLVQETGEHVILCAGELHLERCLKDLRERFAKCAIQASKPLVPFRETAVKGQEMPPPKTEGAARGTMQGSLSGGAVTYSIRAVPLPEKVTDFLIANARTIRQLVSTDRRHGATNAGRETVETIAGSNASEVEAASREVRPQNFWSELIKLLDSCGPQWRGVVDQIWSLGPRRVGPNLLVDSAGLLTQRLRQRTELRKGPLKESQPASGVSTPAGQGAQLTGDSEVDDLASALEHATLPEAAEDSRSQESWTAEDLLDSIESGFQIATLQGPLCAEQVQGLAYFVESVVVNHAVEEREGNRIKFSQITGSLISSVREACRNGLLDWSPRIMLAMYSCDIQASTDVLGKVHAVLSRRRGRITSEEMKEGTSFFTVGALLPVVESFGFADEIRKRTSGAASPQLIFKGFELFDVDPYWVPRTEEELEDLGVLGERENVAKKYVDNVRKRKGLFVDRRIVDAAEKQRTLKSN
ncbi:putative Tef2-translation elongation factor 2-putative [Ceraceosorus guamensis]|uniref:Elongation factor-like 1 n=1 Tax=Ceraceosorus guamensis TaxID=1522189 RepID=A0A316W5K5_9BASI|nr:putative Tef2-translation elongation factor 2-putative [Ceraceosorus guamensis]PWN42935.1 putative Tef2-translation elongation factor 2-putative [Ceraceosorus guamensis]